SREGSLGPTCDNHARVQRGHFMRKRQRPTVLSGIPTIVDQQVAAVRPSQFFEAVHQCSNQQLSLSIALAECHQYGYQCDSARAASGRATESQDELPPLHRTPLAAEEMPRD